MVGFGEIYFMKLKQTLSLLSDVITGFLVFLFLCTALSKLYNPAGFIGAMQHNPLLFPYAHLLSWMVPLIEIAIVLLLFFPLTRRIGMLMSVILLSIFAGYIGYMLLINSKLPCTCGGIMEDMSWVQHLLFNLSIAFLSLAAWFYHPKLLVATKQESPNTCRK